MTAAASLPPPKGKWLSMEWLAPRLAEATPTLMILGPATALLYLLTASLAHLRA